MTTDTFGSRLAQARRWVGISQKAFGQLVGVSRETISAWENDKGSPGVEQLLVIADELDRDPCWFVRDLSVGAQPTRQSGWIYGFQPSLFASSTDPPDRRAA